METTTRSAPQGRLLLDRARAGDEDAYRRLVEPHRRELHAHCYRMLGSSHDADDALQNALLRAWRALPRFEARRPLRAWLYAIATNASLRLIERRPKRMLPIDGAPLLESAWLEPYPDEPSGLGARRESIELAFIAALQHLPANQRAVLILREVLGFSAREVADALDTTVASVNSALQRARRSVDERVPEQSQQANLRAIGDRRLRRVVAEYMDAIELGDVDRLVALLAEDATWSMLAGGGDRAHGPRTWYRGRRAIAAFLTAGPLSGNWQWRHVATTANGQPAVAGYVWHPGLSVHRLRVLDVLTLANERIAAVTAFLDPTVLHRFGLSDELGWATRASAGHP